MLVISNSGRVSSGQIVTGRRADQFPARQDAIDALITQAAATGQGVTVEYSSSRTVVTLSSALNPPIDNSPQGHAVRRIREIADEVSSFSRNVQLQEALNDYADELTQNARGSIQYDYDYVYNLLGITNSHQLVDVIDNGARPWTELKAQPAQSVRTVQPKLDPEERYNLAVELNQIGKAAVSLPEGSMSREPIMVAAAERAKVNGESLHDLMRRHLHAAGKSFTDGGIADATIFAKLVELAPNPEFMSEKAIVDERLTERAKVNSELLELKVIAKTYLEMEHVGSGAHGNSARHAVEIAVQQRARAQRASEENYLRRLGVIETITLGFMQPVQVTEEFTERVLSAVPDELVISTIPDFANYSEYSFVKEVALETGGHLDTEEIFESAREYLIENKMASEAELDCFTNVELVELWSYPSETDFAGKVRKAYKQYVENEAINRIQRRKLYFLLNEINLLARTNKPEDIIVALKAHPAVIQSGGNVSKLYDSLEISTSEDSHPLLKLAEMISLNSFKSGSLTQLVPADFPDENAVPAPVIADTIVDADAYAAVESLSWLR